MIICASGSRELASFTLCATLCATFWATLRAVSRRIGVLTVIVLVRVFELYLAAGVLFAAVFVSAGVGRVDPGARGAGVGLRLLLVPGSILLWPHLVWRWAARAPHPLEVNAHRLAARSREATDAGVER